MPWFPKVIHFPRDYESVHLCEQSIETWWNEPLKVHSCFFSTWWWLPLLESSMLFFKLTVSDPWRVHIILVVYLASGKISFPAEVPCRLKERRKMKGKTMSLHCSRVINKCIFLGFMWRVALKYRGLFTISSTVQLVCICPYCRRKNRTN